MRRVLLRTLLVLDAAILFLLGGAFMAVPGRMLHLFGFHGAPPSIAYIVGVFGSVYFSLGIGYVLAAQNPLRNVVWVQVAIARGAAECLFSLLCVAQGIISFRQASLSIIVPALLVVGYILFYPRPLPIPEETTPPLLNATP